MFGSCVGNGLKHFGQGLFDSDKAVVFVDNHDTQRHQKGYLTFKNGAVYDLANVFMLAHPYGHPKVKKSCACVCACMCACVRV
jgi:alpha-amylase